MGGEGGKGERMGRGKRGSKERGREERKGGLKEGTAKEGRERRTEKGRRGREGKV